MSGAPTPVVQRGTITALRLFDIAYAVDLDRARELCANLPAAGSPPGSLTFDVPPVRVRWPDVDFAVGDTTMRGQVAVHVYEFGTITLAVSLVVEDLSWPDFVDKARRVEEALSSHRSTEPWTTLLADVQALIGPALERPGDTVIEEDYQLIEVGAFREPLGDALHRVVDLTPLLANDSRALSQDTRDTLLRHRFGYLADDCVVVGRDRAFLYQPGGDAGIAAVLEVANAQLLELRYYGDLLEDELPRMYDLVDSTRNVPRLTAPAQLARLARRLYTVVAEVTELTEKVENALEATGHPYLARIYTTTLELFGVPALSAAVDRKLEIVRDTYTALYDEASVSRAGMLEIIIVVLIAVELVLALVKS